MIMNKKRAAIKSIIGIKNNRSIITTNIKNKKNKLPAKGFEPLTFRLKVHPTTTALFKPLIIYIIEIIYRQPLLKKVVTSISHFLGLSHKNNAFIFNFKIISKLGIVTQA